MVARGSVALPRSHSHCTETRNAFNAKCRIRMKRSCILQDEIETNWNVRLWTSSNGVPHGIPCGRRYGAQPTAAWAQATNYIWYIHVCARVLKFRVRFDSTTSERNAYQLGGYESMLFQNNVARLFFIVSFYSTSCCSIVRMKRRRKKREKCLLMASYEHEHTLHAQPGTHITNTHSLTHSLVDKNAAEKCRPHSFATNRFPLVCASERESPNEWTEKERARNTNGRRAKTEKNTAGIGSRCELLRKSGRANRYGVTVKEN